MPPLAALAALALALAAAVAARLLRKVRALEQELASVSERVDELSARLEVAEQDAAAALAQAEVAESVLLDKGVADEDDLEAARARSTSVDAPRHGRHGDGDLH